MKFNILAFLRIELSLCAKYCNFAPLTFPTYPKININYEFIYGAFK